MLSSLCKYIYCVVYLSSYSVRQCKNRGGAKIGTEMKYNYRSTGTNSRHTFKISRKEREAKGKKKRKKELSLDDEDTYEGFNKDGSRIA